MTYGLDVKKKPKVFF